MKTWPVWFWMLFPMRGMAADFEGPGIRGAVDRQLAPYRLPGWHALSPASTRVERVERSVEEPTEVVRARTERVNVLLDAILIPVVEFQEMPLQDALEWLHNKVREYGRGFAQKSGRERLNSVIISSRVSNRRDTFDPKVSLKMADTSVREVLTRLGEPFGLEVDVWSYWVGLSGR